MKAIFTRFGIRTFRPTLRKAEEKLQGLRTAEGTPLPENTCAELRRHLARLRVVREQIRAVEQQRLRKLASVAATEKKGPHAMVRLIARVLGVGVETADILVTEVFSHQWRNRKAVARYAGLTGSPDESGRRQRERGLARAGNIRVGFCRHTRHTRHGTVRAPRSCLLRTPARKRRGFKTGGGADVTRRFGGVGHHIGSRT
jgi:transposase